MRRGKARIFSFWKVREKKMLGIYVYYYKHMVIGVFQCEN